MCVPDRSADGDRFPPDELAARRGHVRRRLEAAGLDACVVLAPETQLWLCGLDSFISGVLPQAFVLPQVETEEPALVVWDADVPLARATSTIEDIRAYRFGVDDPAAAFAAVVAEKAPEAQQVGFDAASRAVPHALGTALGRAVAPARLVDCSALLADARTVKSPLELEYLRRAGQHADAGLSAAREYARPGVSERRLAAGVRLYEVALACLRAGLAAVEPGVEARAVEAPALAVLRDAGMGDGFKMRFGYGVGLA